MDKIYTDDDILYWAETMMSPEQLVTLLDLSSYDIVEAFEAGVLRISRDIIIEKLKEMQTYGV